MTPAASCPPDTRPLPEHGTYARAKGRPGTGIKGCICPPCRKADNDYNKYRRVLKVTGRSITVDAAPAANHLRALLAAGNGWPQTAAALNCNESSIYRLVSGEQKTISRRRAARIFALTPNPAPESRVPPLGTVRRIRALIAVGHQVKAIAAHAGLSASVLNDLIHDRKPSVRYQTSRRVADTYEALRGVPGGHVQSVNRARREGWPTPAEWAGDIDDPDVDPRVVVGGRVPDPTAEEIVENAEWLREQTGGSWDAIAMQLKIRTDTLHTYRSRVRERAAANAGGAT